MVQRSALILLSAASAAAAACVYDPAVDYFAGRTPFAPRHAQTFSVTFERTPTTQYKRINVTSGGVTSIITLSVCGAPLPSVPAAGADEVIQLSLPLETAGITSATYLTYFQLLGLEKGVTAVAGAQYFNSPCLRLAASAAGGNTVSDVAADDDYGYFDVTKPAAAMTDVVFRDAAAYARLSSGKDVPMAPTLEVTPQAVMDWAGYIATFLDVEDVAVSQLAKLDSTYRAAVQCIASLTSEAVTSAKAAGLTPPPTPRVAWGSYYQNTWYVGFAPNYYSTLIENAGGALLPPPPGYAVATGLTNAEFADYASTADVLIYTGSDWSANIAPVLSSASIPAASLDLSKALSAIPAVRTKRVFDILASGVNAWFEDIPTTGNPALLLDLLSAINPSTYTTLGLATRAHVYLRNVFTSPIGTLSPTSTCTDASAAAQMRIASFQCPARNSAAFPFSDTFTPEQLTGVIVGSLVAAAIAIGITLWLRMRVVRVAGGAASAAGVQRPPKVEAAGTVVVLREVAAQV